MIFLSVSHLKGTNFGDLALPDQYSLIMSNKKLVSNANLIVPIHIKVILSGEPSK